MDFVKRAGALELQRQTGQPRVVEIREAKFQDLLESQALEPAIGTPEQVAAFLKEDRARGALVVKRFNIPKQ